MTEQPKTYRVQARSQPGGVAQVTVGDRSVSVDTGWGVDPSGAPGPAELLAGAFAACLMKNIERSSKLVGFAYEGADIEVEATRQDAPPRFVEVAYEVRIVTDEPARRVDLLHRNLRQFGTVYNTLAAVCDVHGRVIAVAPES